MKDNLVSVIIPCYNVEKYIEKCLDSIIKQSKQDIEIICIDDGSNDNTKSVIEKYKNIDNRIQLISKKNEGVSVARNIGIKMASGEYIMFVDSDDYIDEKMIENMFYKAKEYNVDIVKCNRYDVYINNNKKIERKPIWNTDTYLEKKDFKENIYKEFYRRNRLCSTCMTLIKSELIKNNEILFNTELKVDEDSLFSMQMFDKANSFLYIPNPYYYYIKHKNGLSSKGINLEERIESRKENCIIIKDFFKKWKFNEKEILNEKIAFIGIYTAFQTSRINKNYTFVSKYKIFKKCILDNIFYECIKKSNYSNMIVNEKILCWLVKKHLFFISYIYSISANIVIDILRPLLEKYRN